MTREDPALERAEKHVKNVRDFLYHLMTYLLVNVLLVIIDRRGGTGDQAILGLDWAYWVILFWGFGIMGHAVYTFFGDHRVRKVYEQEMGRERGR